MNSEVPGHYCGIVGVYNHPDAAHLTYLGLYALQHRGQESAGIIASDGKRLRGHRAAGLVGDVFDEESLAKLSGHMAIGHVRYSTTGSNTLSNAQPLLVKYNRGQLAVAHNGNLINAAELRAELEGRGAIFQGTSDSEVLVHLIAQTSAHQDFLEGLTTSLYRVKGAYSLLFLCENRMVAVKDPRGIRPLCIGKLGEATVVASESGALDIMGAQYLREVRNGEMLILDEDGIRIENPFPPVDEHFCIFEYIYFSRPDSRAPTGRTIYEIRHAFGERLAAECPVEADVVVPIPDSSNAAAIGFSKASGIPFDLGLIRSHYIGRTFIEPSDGIRHFGAKLKYSPVQSVLEGKRVVLVDDSIVRGTTSRKIVEMVRKAGAREIHMRISAPPWKHPCYYGIDTPNEGELIANKMDEGEMARALHCDSIGFISIEGLRAVAPKTLGYCTACFSGDYTAGKPSDFKKDMMETHEPSATPR
jgi:amidophosphoribosyltransferase